jgi:ATP-binding cassette, subfamily A (ABC1), member 3
MMTGVTAATRGDVYLMGSSITWEMKEAQKHFGYCPQFDALIDQLTVYETLFMYARLRGIAESSIDKNIDSIINLAMLQKHQKKQAGTLRYLCGC